jgi:hypothetical protein
MRVVVAFVTIMALMAVALMPVDMALGQEANPERVLPHTVERGDKFDVTVTFTAPANEFNSIGLTDLCPDGWKVEVNKAWCTPNADAFTDKNNKAEIIWFGEPDVGFDNGTSFTALYKVTVPYDASAGIYTFDGVVEYWFGPEGPYNETVTGDSEVEVVAGQEANPSRTLPEVVERGQTFDATVTFIAPADKFNAIGLTDFCPDGWDVTVNVAWCTPVATLVKGTGNKVEIGWSGEPDVGFDNGTLFTAVYRVTVPGDAPAGIYTFGGSVEYQVGPKGPYLENITGDSEVKVSVSREEANPSRILPEVVERGQTFDVTVTFTATADNFTAISLLDLCPDDWDVTVDKTWCQPQGSWTKATGNMAEVAWQGPYNGGVDFTALYKVTVPCDASVGSYVFDGYEGLGYYVGPSGHIFENITGDSEVEVVPPAICSNQSISLYAAAVGQNPENETLELWSSTSCMLKWSLTDDAAWLAEYPTNGSCTDVPSPVNLSANASAMPRGNYSASITITSPGASNNRQIVPVTLYVGVSPPSPAQFTITGLDVTPEQVLPGQPVTVSAQVTNVGGSEGNYTVNLTVNGQVEQTKAVTLAPEAMEPVTFTVTKEAPGSYTVSIGDLTKEFTVVAPSWLSRYWWTIVVGVAAVVLLAYFLRRRRAA